ncbi:MAG TPA: hypothetical protein VMR14_14650 [Streptosporangiaceae bacterium]|nr:hypothetical protein [Streptosporangiaceae bacterium]
MQASKLADQTRPMTSKATMTARRRAGGAATWAKPRVGRVRAWMAVRAASGSVSMQDNIGPKVSAMLAATARRLDPPAPASRRWPKVLAGTMLLAAGAAAAGAMAMRNRARTTPPPMPQRLSSNGDSARRSTMANPPTGSQHPMSDSDVNGLSRSR